MNRDTLKCLERIAEEAGDYSKLIAYVEPIAQSGDAEAQCYFASLHHLGTGFPHNGAVAADWYQRSAKQRYALASHNLSTLYAVGDQHLEPNEELATYWNSKAKQQGFPS